MGEKTERGNYLPSLVAGLGIHQLSYELIPKPSCWAIQCNSLATTISWCWF